MTAPPPLEGCIWIFPQGEQSAATLGAAVSRRAVTDSGSPIGDVWSRRRSRCSLTSGEDRRFSGVSAHFRIRPAVPDDVDVLHRFVIELAEAEQFPGEVTAQPGDLAGALFGEGAVAEAVVATLDAQPVGFALYYPSYSTIVGRPGCTWKTCTYAPSTAVQGSASPCWPTWHAPRCSAAAPGWSGGCYAPTIPRCASTGACTPAAWTRSRSCAWTGSRCRPSQPAPSQRRRSMGDGPDGPDDRHLHTRRRSPVLLSEPSPGGSVGTRTPARPR